jgi:hypothetical protein
LTAGTANTGGGGGGAGITGNAGAAGGSGIVILRYPKGTSLDNATGGTVTENAYWRIHTFTTVGTFNFQT